MEATGGNMAGPEQDVQERGQRKFQDGMQGIPTLPGGKRQTSQGEWSRSGRGQRKRKAGEVRRMERLQAGFFKFTSYSPVWMLMIGKKIKSKK